MQVVKYVEMIFTLNDLCIMFKEMCVTIVRQESQGIIEPNTPINVSVVMK